MIDIVFGATAYLRGDFNAATLAIEAATAGLTAADQHKVDADWGKNVVGNANWLADVFSGSSLLMGQL